MTKNEKKMKKKDKRKRKRKTKTNKAVYTANPSRVLLGRGSKKYKKA